MSGSLDIAFLVGLGRILKGETRRWEGNRENACLVMIVGDVIKTKADAVCS